MLRNGLYNILSAVIRLGLAVVTIPLLIRIIGLETYGLWSFVSAIIALVALAEAGLSVTTTVFVSRDLAAENRLQLTQTLTVTGGGMLFLATAIAVILWLAAPAATFLPNLTSAQQIAAVAALRAGTIGVWARLLQPVLIGIEQAYNRYGLLNILVTIQSLLTSLGTVAVAWAGGRVAEMMMWLSLVGALMLGAHLLVVWRLVYGQATRLTWSWQHARQIGRYSLFTWVSALGGALFNQCDRLIVGAILGVEPLAIYAAITTVTYQINMLSAMPAQPLLPQLGAMAKTSTADQYRPQLRQALEMNAFVACALGGSLFLLAPILMQILLPEALSVETLIALDSAILIYALYSLNAVGYFVLLGIRAVRICTANVLFSGVMSLAFIAIGAHYGGLVGAVAGNAGYLATLYLTWQGMRSFGLPARTWLSWMAPALAWLGLALGVSIWAPTSTDWRLALTIIALVPLGFWFLITQRLQLEPFVRQLVARLK